MNSEPPPPLGHGTPQGVPLSRFTLLQEELIEVRSRLDRQIAQLTRLNRIANSLLLREGDEERLADFAEAIPDVLDMAVGVVWEVRGGRMVGVGCSPRGSDPNAWRPLGEALLEQLGNGLSGEAVELPPHQRERIAPPGDLQLRDVLVCACISPEGECVGLALAANTRHLGGTAAALSAETRAVFRQIGERIASFLSNQRSRELQRCQLQQLQESEERLRRVLRSTSDGWWDWDLRSNRCLLSSRWVEMLGGDAREPTLQEGFWLGRVHPHAREAFAHGLRQALEGDSEAGLNVEVELLRDDGLYLPVLVRGTSSHGDDGRAIRFCGTIIDLSEQRRHEAHLKRLAHHDSLTDLPNKQGLLEALPAVIVQHQRSGQRLAVLVINLDGYKNLNDTHGHSAGDQILPMVAGRLRQTLRGSDLIVRWGGDEFVVVLCELGLEPTAAQAHALRQAQVLMDRLSQPYQLRTGVSHHTASLGVALLDERSPSAETLLQHAGTALSEAKTCGGALVRLFQSDMQLMRAERSQLERELRHALDREELQLLYQGIVDREGRLCGAEALSRWTPPGAPAVIPDRFIPVAEASGLIQRLGNWSLGRIADQLQRWDGRLSSSFRFSLNLSARQFLHPQFADGMLAALEAYGLPASRLKLEITEATLLDNLNRTAARMNQLRERGLEFSLDDFGTGYSSISYLRDLPLSEVKLDKRYVRNFLNDRNDAAILQAVLGLCHTMGLRLVAEGVESEAQWQRLRELGCDRFQGFLFSKPVEPGTEPDSLLLPCWQRSDPELSPPA